MTEPLHNPPDEPVRRLGAEDPPPDDEPPDIITDEGGTIRSKELIIEIRSPQGGQHVVQGDGGRVTLALHGTVGEKAVDADTGEPVLLPLRDDEHEWLLDDEAKVVLVGAQGTVTPSLAVGPHTVTLRAGGAALRKMQVTITVDAAPRLSFFDRLLAFFRRLFGR